MQNKLIGVKRIMNNGQKATCIAYKDYFNIDIKFEDGTVVKGIRKDAFTSGQAKNPNYNGSSSISILGMTKTMNNGQKATCIAYRKFYDIDVRFEDGTVVKGKRKDSFITGGIDNPNYDPNSILGKTILMNCGKKATCIAYRRSYDIDVKFEDGSIVNTNKGNFLKGAVKDPKITPNCENKELTMRNGLKAKCIKYRKSNDIDIQFEDGTIIKHVSKGNFYKGTVGYPKKKTLTGKIISRNNIAEKCIGLTKTMNCGLKATIIRFISSRDIAVELESGEIIEHTYKHQFDKGMLGAKYIKRKEFVEKYKSKINSLEKEWNPVKNGAKTLKDYIYRNGSNKKVWWLLPYDDPRTGKHFDFEWKTDLFLRLKKNYKCPYLFKGKLFIGFNDLKTVNPNLAKEWHPTKNGNLLPSQVVYTCGKKVWWLLPYDDPRTGKHFDFEWQASINSRKNGTGCPYISKPPKLVYKGFNDLETLFPEVAKEWHPTKNGKTKPSDYLPGTNKIVWWYLPYDDPKTGKHFDFEWKSTINGRTINNLRCPFLSNQRLWSGFNDLETTNPELLDTWNYERNKIKPSEIGVGTHIKVWWKCKHCGYEWKTQPSNKGRTLCPRCKSYVSSSYPEQALYFYIKKYFKDAINRDKHLGFELDIYIPSINTAIEYDGRRWHKNIDKDLKKNEQCKGKVKLIRVREKECASLVSSKDCVIFDVSGNIDQSLENAVIGVLQHIGIKDPIVNIKKDKNKIMEHYVGQAYKGSLTVKYPNLAKEWHPTKNGKLKPDNFSAKSNYSVWWLLPYDDPKTGKHFDFEWKASICSRAAGSGCPYLKNQKVFKGFNDLATTHPEILKFWDFKNNSKSPYEIPAGTEYKAKFVCPDCGKRFDMFVYRFIKRKCECPKCKLEEVMAKKRRKIVNIDTGVIYESIAKAAQKNHIHITSIMNCLLKKTKTAGGYRWEYLK